MISTTTTRVRRGTFEAKVQAAEAARDIKALGGLLCRATHVLRLATIQMGIAKIRAEGAVNAELRAASEFACRSIDHGRDPLTAIAQEQLRRAGAKSSALQARESHCRSRVLDLRRMYWRARFALERAHASR